MDKKQVNRNQDPKGHYPKTREEYLEIYKNITNHIHRQEELGITGIEAEFPLGELSMLKRCYRGLYDGDLENDARLFC